MQTTQIMRGRWKRESGCSQESLGNCKSSWRDWMLCRKKQKWEMPEGEGPSGRWALLRACSLTRHSWKAALVSVRGLQTLLHRKASDGAIFLISKLRLPPHWAQLLCTLYSCSTSPSPHCLSLFLSTQGYWVSSMSPNWVGIGNIALSQADTPLRNSLSSFLGYFFSYVFDPSFKNTLYISSPS